MQHDPITEADRIAVNNLFREIAEYGRRVRERRAAEQAAADQKKQKSGKVQVAEGESQSPA